MIKQLHIWCRLYIDITTRVYTNWVILLLTDAYITLIHSDTDTDDVVDPSGKLLYTHITLI